MGFRSLALLAVLALAACGQSPAPAVDQAAAPAANACDARATGAWQEVYTVAASTAGPTCAGATATLTVTNAQGVELLNFSAPTEQVMTLAPAQDVAAMRTALADWIKGDDMPTTARLPVWTAGASTPQVEFPFYHEENITQQRYEAVRAADLPMFCFVQGMESMACHVLEDGALTKLGVQSFPG